MLKIEAGYYVQLLQFQQIAHLVFHGYVQTQDSHITPKPNLHRPTSDTKNMNHNTAIA